MNTRLFTRAPEDKGAEMDIIEKYDKVIAYSGTKVVLNLH